MRTKLWLANLLLLATAAIWGTTFTIVKDALQSVGPLEFIAVRMTIAAVIVTAFTAFTRLRTNQLYLVPGLTAGVLLFGGYALQTAGLQYTSASRAAFLTGLYVVLVPIVISLTTRRRTPGLAWLAAGIALLGTTLLTSPDGGTPGPGELMILGCAVCFAGQIITVGRYARSVDTLRFVNGQLWLVAALALVGALALEQWSPSAMVRYSPAVWVALLVTAVFATSFAFWAQCVAQRHTSATYAALLFATEPVFAAAFAYSLGREVLTALGLIGGGCIVAAMVLGGLAEAEVNRPREMIPD